METNPFLKGNFAVTFVAKKSRKVVTFVVRTDCNVNSPFKGKRILTLAGMDVAPKGMSDFQAAQLGPGKLKNPKSFKPDPKCIIDRKCAFVTDDGFINIFSKIKDDEGYKGNDPKQVAAKKQAELIIGARKLLIVPPAKITANYHAWYRKLCAGCNMDLGDHKPYEAHDGTQPLPFDPHKCSKCADGYVHTTGILKP